MTTGHTKHIISVITYLAALDQKIIIESKSHPHLKLISFLSFAQACLIQQHKWPACKSRFKAVWGWRHFIYVKTLWPFPLWDKGPGEPCEQVGVGEPICMCSGIKRPPHGKTGPLHTICVRVPMGNVQCVSNLFFVNFFF